MEMSMHAMSASSHHSGRRFERRRKPRETERIAHAVLTLQEERLAALEHVLARVRAKEDSDLDWMIEALEQERDSIRREQRMAHAYFLALEAELLALR